VSDRTPSGKPVLDPGERAHESLVASPGPTPGTIQTRSGEVVRVPEGWVKLEPGDATVTRRVKSAGPHWVVQVRRRNRNVSVGVWAPADRIARIRAQVDSMRQTPEHKRQLQAGRERREEEQANYVESFHQAVIDFLAFHPDHDALAQRLAHAVATHATPVGSGTVARTQRIPIEQRAGAAVIAWMRHQTTAYDKMSIPRVKGRRREVRRMLAERSRQLLAGYRAGDAAPANCPLAAALADLGSEPAPSRPQRQHAQEADHGAPPAQTDGANPAETKPSRSVGSGIRGILSTRMKKRG